MKLLNALWIGLALLTAVSSCDETTTIIEPPVVEGAITVMPLGDSRVEGARPVYESYRYELWKNMIDKNRVVDFVGTRKDEANYTAYKGNNFDRDHEGTGGATSFDILETIQAINSANAPDIVLLDIGGNDLLEGSKSVAQTVQNIKEIIEYLQTQNEQIIIILEQIAPGKSNFITPEQWILFNEFNDQIPEIANSQSTITSTVTFANMAKDWTDDWLADEVHYNEAGAKIVADRYFEILDPFLAN